MSVRFNFIDQCLAGVPLWRRRLRAAEARLLRTREESSEERVAYAECRRYDFAVRFGRPAAPPVMRFVEAARTAGIDPRALSVLVVNRDFQVTGAGVTLRKRSVVTVLAWAVRLVSVAAVLEFALLTFSAAAPWWIRLAVFSGAMGALLPCLYVLHFFSARSLRAMQQVESDQRVFSQLGEAAERASNVVHFDRPRRRW